MCICCTGALTGNPVEDMPNLARDITLQFALSCLDLCISQIRVSKIPIKSPFLPEEMLKLKAWSRLNKLKIDLTEDLQFD